MKTHLIKKAEHVLSHLERYETLEVSIDKGSHATARTICKQMANDGVLDVLVVRNLFIYALAAKD